MRADLGQIYDDTITLINKLDAKDSALKQDSYYTTVIPHCMWTVTSTRAVQSDGTVNIGSVHKVQIPEDERYIPYREWCMDDERAEKFTISEGDYVVKGEVVEEITAKTLRDIVRKYEPDAFQVQLFRNATKGEGFTHSTDGALRFAEVYYVEG